MEILLVLYLPLVAGPFVLAYGEFMLASFKPFCSLVPIARVRTRQRIPDLKGSLRYRGKQNLVRGALLSAGMALVCLALFEAA